VASSVTVLDALLLAMVVIWGANYSIVKSAIRDVPPLAFNAARLALASAVFAAALWIRHRRKQILISSDSQISRSSNPEILRSPNLQIRRSSNPQLLRSSNSQLLRSSNLWCLALVGNTAYQLLFIVALSRTTAANSSLIIGCTPVFVALMTAALGHERIPPARWAGVALSAAGIYLVVGRGAGVTHETLRGDLLMLTAVFCWSAASIISRPLLVREEPFAVTAWSMILGSLIYLPFASTQLRAVRWTAVAPGAWLAIVFSGVMALCVSYVIWYTAVQRIGTTRTAIYSNMVPVAGLLIAWAGYGETVGAARIAGAAAIVGGLVLTRV
jgi:drug/metabolite transporter (DMT)-like permease